MFYLFFRSEGFNLQDIINSADDFFRIDSLITYSKRITSSVLVIERFAL